PVWGGPIIHTFSGQVTNVANCFPNLSLCGGIAVGDRFSGTLSVDPNAQVVNGPGVGYVYYGYVYSLSGTNWRVPLKAFDVATINAATGQLNLTDLAAYPFDTLLMNLVFAPGVLNPNLPDVLGPGDFLSGRFSGIDPFNLGGNLDTFDGFSVPEPSS